MNPSWTVASADGCELAGYEFGGVGDDVLLIAHATGLCGAMYQLLADELTDRFRVVAFDFRGHGDSTRSVEPDPAIDLGWDRMAEDVVAVARHVGADRTHAFGHSMGGGALLLAERAAPGLFESLFLFEPITFPDDVATDGQNMMGDAARRRRPVFASSARGPRPLRQPSAVQPGAGRVPRGVRRERLRGAAGRIGASQVCAGGRGHGVRERPGREAERGTARGDADRRRRRPRRGGPEPGSARPATGGRARQRSPRALRPHRPLRTAAGPVDDRPRPEAPRGSRQVRRAVS